MLNHMIQAMINITITCLVNKYDKDYGKHYDNPTTYDKPHIYLHIYIYRETMTDGRLTTIWYVMSHATHFACNPTASTPCPTGSTP